MARKNKKTRTKVSHKSGLPPGTAVFVGEVKVEETTLSMISFNQDKISVKKLEGTNLDNLNLAGEDIHWLNTNGLHEADSIQKICKKWHIHELIIEDIVNTNHRPKVEIYDDCDYNWCLMVLLIVKMHRIWEHPFLVILMHVNHPWIDSNLLYLSLAQGFVLLVFVPFVYKK